MAGMERSHFAGAPLDITVRPGAKVDLPGAVELPTGSLRLAEAGQVTALPGYEAGDWWVQDAAAALPARVLAAQPGESVRSRLHGLTHFFGGMYLVPELRRAGVKHFHAHFGQNPTTQHAESRCETE